QDVLVNGEGGGQFLFAIGLLGGLFASRLAVHGPVVIRFDQRGHVVDHVDNVHDRNRPGGGSRRGFEYDLARRLGLNGALGSGFLFGGMVVMPDLVLGQGGGVGGPEEGNQGYHVQARFHHSSSSGNFASSVIALSRNHLNRDQPPWRGAWIELSLVNSLYTVRLTVSGP